MAKQKRWITAAIEESATCDTPMPWTRGRPDLWKTRFVCKAQVFKTPPLKKPEMVSA